jgi:Na+-driven multidrug efflux pump
VGLAFGYFVNVAASTRISFLFGQRRVGDVSPVIVDLIRFSFILGLIVPAILIPVSKPLMSWLSNDSETIVDMAFYYLLPVLAGAITAIIFLLGCGILQAQGRTWLFGFAQISSFVLNGLILDPLFLLGFKTGVWGGAMSTMLAELIPGCVIMFFLFRGAFQVTFKWSQFSAGFSPETWIALKVGLASLIMHLSTTIPAVFMQKYMALTAAYVGEFNDIMAIWNVLLRLNQVSICFVLAFNTAFLPAASYAFGRGEYKRILRLIMHFIWITYLWSIFCEILIIFAPTELGKIWSHSDSFLGWVRKLLPNAFLGVFLCPTPYIAIGFLNAVNQPLFSSILSIATNLLPLPIFSSILYFTDGHDPARLAYSYAIRDAFSFVMSIVVVAYPFYQIVKLAREEGKQQRAELHDLEGSPGAKFVEI